jgi:beta-lactamase class A
VVSVGNKTGTWPGALHDVAFIEAGGDLYIVAILTDGTYGWAAIAAVAAAVYGAISG